MKEFSIGVVAILWFVITFVSLIVAAISFAGEQVPKSTMSSSIIAYGSVMWGVSIMVMFARAAEFVLNFLNHK